MLAMRQPGQTQRSQQFCDQALKGRVVSWAMQAELIGATQFSQHAQQPLGRPAKLACGTLCFPLMRLHLRCTPVISIAAILHL